MDIKRLAQLAQVALSETEEREFEGQISKILNYFQKIDEVDVEGIEPLITPLNEPLILREDEVRQDLLIEDVLKNASEVVGHLFKVPPVV